MRIRNTFRRGLATAAVLSTAVVTVGIASTAAHATSTVGGPITAAEMMSRAQFWVDNHVPYTESGATAPDPQGTQYREDCSGFVSMAWHLNTSLIVTDPAPYDFTNVDGTPNTAYDTGIGAFTNLQQGDAMAYPHQHIFLFDNWTDKDTGDFTYYAESNPSDPTHGPTSANINSTSLEGWPTSGYVGLRYNNLSVPTPPPTVQSSSGGLAATPGGGFNIAWQGRDSNNSLWVGSGSGVGLNPAADPFALGVAPGTTPSITTLADGSWVAAWHGRDANNTLWLATGTGNSITWKGNPYAYGVADNTSPSIVALAGGGYEVAWRAATATTACGWPAAAAPA
jgi:hypothetical protein